MTIKILSTHFHIEMIIIYKLNTISWCWLALCVVILKTTGRVVLERRGDVWLEPEGRSRDSTGSGLIGSPTTTEVKPWLPITSLIDRLFFYLIFLLSFRIFSVNNIWLYFRIVLPQGERKERMGERRVFHSLINVMCFGNSNIINTIV